MKGLSGFPSVKSISISTIPVSILGKIQGILWGELSDTFAAKWELYYAKTDADGNVGDYQPVNYIDSILSVESSVQANIPTYPRQKNSFASYNKIVMPRTVTCRLVGANQNKTTMAENFKREVESHEGRWRVVTPNEAFENLQMTVCDVHHAAEDGSADLLIVEVVFTEIREVDVDYYKAGEKQADTSKSEKAEDKPTTPTSFVDKVLYEAKNIRATVQGQINRVSAEVESVLDRIRKELPNGL